MSVDVDYDGPLFDGRAEIYTDDFCEESEEHLARQGARYVREFADGHFRQRTGAYESRVKAQRSRGAWEVTDQRSDYGPWLAGTSKRNKRNEFKGYPHWREARELLDADAVRIVEPVLRRYRRRLRGGA